MMKRTDDFQKHSVTMEVRPDGTQLMSSTEPLSAVMNSTGACLTETTPATLMQQEPTDRSGVVGNPLNNVVAKLIPEDDNRFEIRVSGSNQHCF